MVAMVTTFPELIERINKAKEVLADAKDAKEVKVKIKVKIKKDAEDSSIELTMPLFIRCMEFAREEAPEGEEGDLYIHRLAECAADFDRCLGMDDYEDLTDAAEG